MASRYDKLDPSTELEQVLTGDLRAALEPRGCEVVHHGASAGKSHSPGGKPDIEVRDNANRHLILVEVTKRFGSAAEGEYLAVADHLDKAIAQGGYDQYSLLYISPRTSARISTNFRDFYNRGNQRQGRQGRIVAIDFATAQLIVDRLSESDPDLYPAERLRTVFDGWDEAVDDARARKLFVRRLLVEDHKLRLEVETEERQYDAERERALKKALEKAENKLRELGVTGHNANTTLVYLAFIRLYEERAQRRTGIANRFTLSGFTAWKQTVGSSNAKQYGNRLVELLLHEIANDDSEIEDAGLLRDGSGQLDRLHENIDDALVEREVLPLFDEYDFHAGRVDVLGAVFETLARRGEKDTRIGQFFTPQQVVNFCADVADLSPRDVVCDPAVGTGRFLIAAMERMLAGVDGGSHEKAEAEEAIRKHQLLGADIDRWVATIAKMNMFLHGDGKSAIASANGLVLGDRSVLPRRTKGVSGTLDVVLTNPPLGSTSFDVTASHWASYAASDVGVDKRLAFLERLGVISFRTLEETEQAELQLKIDAAQAKLERLEGVEPAQRDKRKIATTRRSRDRYSTDLATVRSKLEQGDVRREPVGEKLKGGALFLGAIADYLKRDRLPHKPIESRGGVAAVVVDDAILNTVDYTHVREFIRRNFFVKAVVSLARDAFKYLAHTDAKTSVLVLTRKPSEALVQREPVFFAHADRVGYSAKGDWVGDDLPQIGLTYRQFRAAVDRSYDGAHFDQAAARASVEQLPGYAEAFFARFSFEAADDRLDYFNARFLQRRAELLDHFGEVRTIGDFIEPRTRVSPEADPNDEYDFASISRITASVERRGAQRTSYPPSSLWIVERDDILVSGIDLVNGAVALADDDVAGAVMSNEMFAYRVRAGVVAEREYIQLVLRTSLSRELLMGLTSGTSNRTRLVHAEQLLQLPVPPLPAPSAQAELAAKVRASHETRRTAREQFEDAHRTVEISWGRPRPELEAGLSLGVGADRVG